MLICGIASALAILRVVTGGFWRNRNDLPYAGAAALALLGSLGAIFIPALHSARFGLFWTLFCLTCVTIVFYRPILRQLGARRGCLLLALRLTVIGLLVLMLFEPVIRYVATRIPDRPLYLLIDASGSMSVPDVQNGPTRFQSVAETIRNQLSTLEQHFAVKLRVFGNDVRALDKPGDLASVTPDAPATDLVKAVSHILDETTRKDAAIVLISDGIDNTQPDPARAIAASLRPIHTLAVGSEQTQSTAVQNIAVESVDYDDELSVGHEAKLSARIRATGLANRVVDVHWSALSPDGKPAGEIKSQKLVLEPRPDGQKLELPFTPEAVGLQRVAVWVDPIPGERTIVDNRQEFQALALDPRIKVLYIEGRARPEYRELRRALDRDANIEVASLLRLQAEKFSVAGTVDGEKVTVMPVSADAWRKFDVIILGDLDASFLTKSQQAAIEHAVVEGAGLIMVGGQSSFGPGSYANSPIEKALPVRVGGIDAAQEKTEFVPRLTTSGAMHPAMEGLAEWFGIADKPGSQKLPPIRGNVVVPSPKSNASILLVHAGRPGPDGNPQIVLATQQYGKGRSAAFTADTTYLWYLSLRGMGQNSPYNRFWGQLVRWLAGADVKHRQQGAGMDAMLSGSVYQLGEPVNVKAMVRDDRGDATRYAVVQMQLNRIGQAETQRTNLSPLESRTGLYELRIPQAAAGDYEMKLTATKDGKPLGQQTLKFTVLAPAEELTQLGAKPQLLADIASKTHGWSYPLAQAPQLVARLISTDTEGTPVRQVLIPLANVARLLPAALGNPADWPTRYDLPLQAALVVTLLMAEWLLRRRWQLS